jgi:Domain of unknown function (DUF4190)
MSDISEGPGWWQASDGRWYGPEQHPSYAPPPPPGPVPGYYTLNPGAVPQRTNGMAIAAMVLGIVWFWWIGSILALIFGYVALRQIKERNESGRGMAVAGIVLGCVGIGVGVIVLFVALLVSKAHFVTP